MSRFHNFKVPLALLALAICSGTLQASTTLALSPTITGNTVALTCDVVSGALSTATVGVTSTTPATSVAAVVTGTSGTQGVGVYLVNGTTSGTPQIVGSTPVNFYIHMSPGCRNATSGTSVNIAFSATGSNVINITANITVTSTNSTALAPSAPSVTLTCAKNVTPTAGPSTQLGITSTAVGGTNFYLDTTVNGTALPPWMASPTGAGTQGSMVAANPGPAVITLATNTTCSALAAGTYPTAGPYLLTLDNPPGAPLKIPVSLVVASASPLNQMSPVSLSYNKTAGTGTNQTPTLSGTVGTFYSVDLTTVPSWLTVSPTSTTIGNSGNQTVTFTAVSGAATLPLGNYTANVHFKVTNYQDMVVTVYLQVKSATESLSVVEAHDQTVNWVIGTPYPAFTITPISTDEPIGYSVSIVDDTSGFNNTLPLPTFNPKTGMAYSFGSPVSISFAPGTFASSQPGDTPKWDVTVTDVTHSSNVASCCSVTVNVLSPGARISSAMPVALSTAAPGTQISLTLTGSGFVSGGPTQKTVVGVVPQGGQFIVLDSGTLGTPTVVSSTTIALTITVPATADPYFPFANGGTVTLGVCNPNGNSSCATPVAGGTITLTIGGGPIIQSVTSASSYIQSTAPAMPTLAPFDIISIFGTNFCISGGTGCTTSPILYGQTTTSGPIQYLTSLSPDPNGTRQLSVIFQTHTTPPTVIGLAPLLFATNNQINVIVPEAVNTAALNQMVDIVVSFGPSGSPAKSAPYSVLIANTDPGIFTVGSGGQGPAAALDQTGSLISSTNQTVVNEASGWISLYVTGLGEPDALDSVAAWTTPASVTCMTKQDYLTAANTSTNPNGNLLIDGLVFQSSLFPTGLIQPCLKSSDTPGSTSNLPSVTIGGLPATVGFAGFVADSVAGLYQINVQLPTGTVGFTSHASNFLDATGAPISNATLASGTTLPVTISARGNQSAQTGVYLNVVGQLSVTPTPAVGTKVTGSHSSAPFTTNGAQIASVAVSGGSGTYTITQSGLPSGFSMDASGNITVTGTVGASNNVTVTISVSDAAAPSGTGFTGSTTIVFNIS